ncbi:hypothetical protein KB206_05340 [Microvirga sp. STS02]|uniref:hypothetical protein n=1 Tax=Hymenobacter negativus TaxID=2795026 RepID=UPI0018DC8BCF|nr:MULTISPECIES: hypothetical protein [Bacteria]MBH8568295.1 hypothetical protein [Hymenobacter negativus]MBR7208030.1 hypothetical protein [Microvirga sp. STS02]
MNANALLDGFELAKQLLKPLQQVMDMAPMFLKGNHLLEIISPEKFSLIHEKNGMRFISTKLRPNRRDFVEQFREAVGKKPGRDQTDPAWPDGRLEI